MQKNNPERYATGQVLFRKTLGAIETSVALPNGTVVWQPQFGQKFALIGAYTRITKIVGAVTTAAKFKLDNGTTGQDVASEVTLPTTVGPWKKMTPTGDLVFDNLHPLRMNLTAPPVQSAPPIVPPATVAPPKEHEVEVVVFAFALNEVQS